MNSIIYIVGSVWGNPTPYDGMYLAGEYTPGDAGTRDVGTLDVTSDPAQARRFADMADAWAFWMQEHPNGVGGARVDGRPNRPLTVFTIFVESVDQ